MAKVGQNIRIIIQGTKRSEILDADEEFIIEYFKDEELREDFADDSDLINHCIEKSYYRGDIIRSLYINDVDFIRNTIIGTLAEFGMNVEEALPKICSMPFLTNADPSDIYEMVLNIASSKENNIEE